jgi:hypothetical protein
MVFLLVVSGAALNRDVPIERVKSRLRFRCRRIHPVGVDRDVQAQVSGIAVTVTRGYSGRTSSVASIPA